MKTADILKIDGVYAVSAVISKEISGVYCGELPGAALGKLKENEAWLTACANINTLAAAYQKNAACVIICDGSQIDDEFKKIADEYEITVFRTHLPVYETAVKIHSLIKSSLN